MTGILSPGNLEKYIHDANILMDTNNTNKNGKLIYPELSYLITGICFEVHNELGRYSKEKQYKDLLEQKFRSIGVNHKREFKINDSGNVADFLVEDKIILELKAKPIVLKEDYYQTQRYMQSSGIRLALLVNFRSRYLKPIRLIRIDTSAKSRFI